MKDRIYAEPRAQVAGFRFDEQVASVFPDMIRRSVPGYGTIIDMIGVFAARYARPGTRLYDLGSSLGAATLAMGALLPHQDCELVAVDNSAAMIERAEALLRAAGLTQPLQQRCEDIRSTELSNASVAVLNFTLQFVPLADRDALMARIAEALVPGGILVLSEKIRFEDAAEDSLQQALHHAFKRNNGYSDLEISQKRTAIENVLIPETLATHRQRLQAAGFDSVHVWFRCFNFMSLLAVKA